jgi:nitrate reductase gamma subunit
MFRLLMIVPFIIKIGFLFFIFGSAIRMVRMASMPVHVRWEIYPVPEGILEKTRIMMSEVLLLKGVFEHHRSLWLWSWLFHTSLYLLIIVAGLSVLASLSMYARTALASGISILSTIAFGFGTVGTAALILMRLFNARMRSFASVAALFNLALLLAIFLSGIAYVFTQPAFASIMVAQSGSLLGLNPAPVLNPIAAAHLGLMAFFIAYFPFTQMAHGMLKYFMYHSVRWDDRPTEQIPKYADEMKRYLAYPVSWSAPHIRDVKANWAEVVSPKDPNKNG